MRTVDVGYTLGYPHYQFVDRVGDTFASMTAAPSQQPTVEVCDDL